VTGWKAENLETLLANYGKAEGQEKNSSNTEVVSRKNENILRKRWSGYVRA